MGISNATVPSNDLLYCYSIRYDEQLREQQNIQKEDLSDMVAEHAARQQKVKGEINNLCHLREARTHVNNPEQLEFCNTVEA